MALKIDSSRPHFREGLVGLASVHASPLTSIGLVQVPGRFRVVLVSGMRGFFDASLSSPGGLGSEYLAWLVSCFAIDSYSLLES